MVVASIQHMSHEMFHFGKLFVCLCAGFAVSFNLLAPHYDLAEDLMVEPASSHPFVYPGRAAWIPLWALFGYFEPTTLEDAPRTVPYIANVF